MQGPVEQCHQPLVAVPIVRAPPPPIRLAQYFLADLALLAPSPGDWVHSCLPFFRKPVTSNAYDLHISVQMVRQIDQRQLFQPA